MASPQPSPAPASAPAPVSAPAFASAPEKVDTSSIESAPAEVAPIIQRPEPAASATSAADEKLEALLEEAVDAPPPKLSRAERKRKRQLLMKIRGYYRAFPTVTGKYDQTWDECDDLEELEELVEDLKLSASAGSSEAMFKGGYFSLLSLGEAVGPRAGLRLTGLTNTARNNETIDGILSEVGLEYSDYLYQDPLYRLIFATAVAAYTVHSINTKTSPPVPVPDETARKFEGL